MVAESLKQNNPLSSYGYRMCWNTLSLRRKQISKMFKKEKREVEIDEIDGQAELNLINNKMFSLMLLLI